MKSYLLVIVGTIIFSIFLVFSEAIVLHFTFYIVQVRMLSNISYSTDSLGGNSRTTMLATVSPCSSHIEETLATLRYASQARSIVNTVRINEAPQDKIIRELKAEVERLKEMHIGTEKLHMSGHDPQEFEGIKTDLVNTKQQLFNTEILLEEVTQKMTNMEESLRRSETEKAALFNKINLLENENLQVNSKLEECNANCQELIENERQNCNKLSEDRENDFKVLKEKFKKLCTDYDTVKTKYKKAEEHHLQKLEMNKALLLDKDEEIASLNREIIELKNICESLKNRLDKMESKENDKNVLNNHETLEELKNKLTHLQDKFITKDELCTALQNKIMTIVKELEQKEAVLKDLDSKCKAINEDKKESNVLSEKIKCLKEQLNQKNDLHNVMSKEISQKNSELKNVQELVCSKEKECSQLREKVKSLDEVQKCYREENISLKDKLEALQEKFSVTEKSYQKIKREIKTLQESFSPNGHEYKKLKNEIEKSVKIQDIEFINQQKVLSETKEELAKLKSENVKLEQENKSFQACLEEQTTNTDKYFKYKEMFDKGQVELKKFLEEHDCLKNYCDEIQEEKTKVQAELENKTTALQEALSQIKVSNSENRVLEKKVSELSVTVKSLQEQIKSSEKGKKELLDKLNQLTGEKSVADYKLRESLGRNKIITDKEEELKFLGEKYENVKEECIKLKKEMSDLHHQLNITKVNEDSLKGELSLKTSQVSTLQTQLNTAHQLQQELMEEKLTIIKVMEKQCMDEQSIQNHKAVVAANTTLKRDMNILEQRLFKKTKKIELLNDKINKLEDILKMVVENRLSTEAEKDFLESALRKKDIDAYDFVMNLSFPHHLEHLIRKGRIFVEKYKIPYDLELRVGNVHIKHLTLCVTAMLNHHKFNCWIQKIEKEGTWRKEFDKDLPWEVDLSNYYENDDNPLCFGESPVKNCGTAINVGVQMTSYGCLNPILWRKMLVKRHVQGIKEDSEVLLRYFPNSEDSRIYSILCRIQASVIRLEEATKDVFR